MLLDWMSPYAVHLDGFTSAQSHLKGPMDEFRRFREVEEWEEYEYASGCARVFLLFFVQGPDDQQCIELAASFLGGHRNFEGQLSSTSRNPLLILSVEPELHIILIRATGV
jgi:hypothetical protein